MLGTYYHQKFGVDFRCLRYPGIVSSEKYEAHGTVSFITEMFFESLESGKYECYLRPDCSVPAIHIEDCVAATL